MNEMEIASLKLDCLRLADGSVSEAEKKFAFVSGTKPSANAPGHAAEGNAEQAAYRTCLDTQLLKAETMNHTTAPKTLPEALNVIRAMHTDLLAFRNPEFDLIALGREGDFDDRVKAVLAHSAPVIKADRHASDCTSDVAIEAEIQAKGNIAPRVTPADLHANIVSEHYFTAADGDQFARFGEQYVTVDAHPSLPLLTFCVLVLRNGFTVTGESACASPENFDPEIGRMIARNNAVQKVWPLMGYALKQQLHETSQQKSATA